MRIIVGIIALAGVAAAALPAAALPLLPGPYTYYRQRLTGDTLTNEHAPPAPGTVVPRRIGRAHVARRVHRHRVARHHVGRRVAHRRDYSRYAASRSIAGFCRDGGLVRRIDDGRPIVVQREICDSIGYYSNNPNEIVRRPDEFTGP